MIVKIDDWSLWNCNDSMEVNNQLVKLLKICDSDDGQPIHIFLTHSTALSDDLHNIMDFFRNKEIAQKYEYVLTTTIKNDRPRVVLNIRWSEEKDAN